MPNSRRFRPSPALVISTIALFVAIGGISWAAATIGTKDIKNGAVITKKLHNGAVATKKIKKNAVNGSKVRNDSLTGTDINESTLGLVPSANHANSADSAANATNAANANTVGGLNVEKIFFKAPANTAATPQFSAAGLTLKLGCAGAMVPIATVSSDSNAVELQGYAVDNSGVAHNYNEDSGFANVDILQNFQGAGELTYATTGGAVVTMHYGFDQGPTYNGETVCTFFGTATHG
jgi:hypothetical protein